MDHYWESANSTDLVLFKNIQASSDNPNSSLFTSSISTKNINDILIDNVSSSTILSHANKSYDEYLRLYPALALFEKQLDAKYIQRINAFWLQFPPPNPKTHYSIAVIYLIMSVFGSVGNALVIYMSIRCKSLRTPANILVLNLAISDFLMLAKCPIVIYNSYNLGPAIGDFGCRLYGFIGGLSGTVSIATLTAISIDRYYVVVYPLDPFRSTSKTRSHLMLIFIWSYSLIFSLCPALNIGLSDYVPEGLLTTCSFDYLSKSVKARLFMFFFFIAAWLIPFTIIGYCYFYILKVVISAKRIQSNKDKSKTEFKLTLIVIGIILLWFLAWTPYAIVALLGITGNENLITPLGSMIPAIFCKTSACIDPYIYAVTHPRFRLEFSRLFLKRKTINRTSTIRSSITTATKRKNTTYEMQLKKKKDMINQLPNITVTTAIQTQTGSELRPESILKKPNNINKINVNIEFTLHNEQFKETSFTTKTDDIKF